MLHSIHSLSIPTVHNDVPMICNAETIAFLLLIFHVHDIHDHFDII